MLRRVSWETQRWWKVRISPALSTIHQARAPFICAIAASASLGFLPQAYEIYRGLALNPSRNTGAFFWTLSAVLLLIGGLWLLVLTLATGDGKFRRAFAACCGAFPLIGAVYGLHQASVATLVYGQDQPTGVLDPTIASVFSTVAELPQRLDIATWSITVAFFAIAAILYRAATLTGIVGLSFATVAAVICGFGILLWIGFAVYPISMAVVIGTIAIVMLFMLVAAGYLSVLFRIRDTYRIPAFSILVGATLVFSWTNISDNHIPPRVPRLPSSPDIQPTSAALKDWLASRGDLEKFRSAGRPYPVFVISAEGGGHFAADFAATFLARAQDRCPRFAQHVFAISSVSGGSIGAGVFAGLAKQFATNGPWTDCSLGTLEPGKFERLTRSLLDRDFLAPVIAATLFGDLPQGFFPWSMPNRDRAEVFDRTLELAWDEVLPGVSDPLAQPFLSFWKPNGVAPAIVANTTQVENGMRVAVAPFMSIDGPLQASVLHQRSRYTRYVDGQLVDDGWEALQKTEDIRLSTALGLSARFPWVMPAARFKTSKTEFRLVDGGYIDNSGDESAFDLIMELKQIQALGGKIVSGQLPDFEIHLITLTTDGAPQPGAVEGFGEILSPVRTLLSSRPTRADIASHRVRVLLNPVPEITVGTLGDFSSPSPLVKLNAQIPLPLTWQLSPTSHRLIAAQVGDAATCIRGEVVALPEKAPQTSAEQAEAIDSINELIRTNSCVSCSIVYRLSGDTAPMGQACAKAAPP